MQAIWTDKQMYHDSKAEGYSVGSVQVIVLQLSYDDLQCQKTLITAGTHRRVALDALRKLAKPILFSPIRKTREICKIIVITHTSTNRASNHCAPQSFFSRDTEKEGCCTC